MRFTKSHVAANRGDTTYSSPESAGVIKLPKSFNGGNHPEILEVTGLDAQGAVVEFAGRKAKATPLTEEQKKAKLAELKAKNAAMTPEQRLAAKKQRAADALARRPRRRRPRVPPRSRSRNRSPSPSSSKRYGPGGTGAAVSSWSDSPPPTAALGFNQSHPGGCSCALRSSTSSNQQSTRRTGPGRNIIPFS